MKRSAITQKYSQIRVLQFVIAELVLIAGLFAIFGQINPNFFWPIIIGLALPTLFSEPYFTPPRAALITAISQI